MLRPKASQVLCWRAIAHLTGSLALPSLRITCEHLQVRPYLQTYLPKVLVKMHRLRGRDAH